VLAEVHSNSAYLSRRRIARMPMQFMNSMADDPRMLTIAEDGIKESPVYESLKLKILAKADLQRRAVPKQCYLFGRQGVRGRHKIIV
jgi:hypothetical protein